MAKSWNADRFYPAWTSAGLGERTGLLFAGVTLLPWSFTKGNGVSILLCRWTKIAGKLQQLAILYVVWEVIWLMLLTLLSGCVCWQLLVSVWNSFLRRTASALITSSVSVGLKVTWTRHLCGHNKKQTWDCYHTETSGQAVCHKD